LVKADWRRRGRDHRDEWRILRAGLLLAAIYLAALGTIIFLYPKQGQVLVGMTLTNIVVGRAGGMSLGYAGGLEHHVVIPANMFIETLQVMILYPLFVFSWNHLLEIRALQRFMTRVKHAAESRREYIHRYGIVGLFVFVFTPFWMTGPVVGSVVGFLIGLRPWVNMGVVLGATYIAIGCWALLLREVHDWAAEYHRYAPLGLATAVIALVLAGRALRKRSGN